MTWTKLGDEFPDAAQDLTDAAFRLHIEALCWSNRRLLDLVIPKRDLKRFAETDDPDTAVKELVMSGWWQDLGDAWSVAVHFAEWQRDKVQVEHKREQDSLRQRRKRQHDLGEHELCLAKNCSAARAEAESADASRRDNAGDSRRDPGRDGTGTEQGGQEGEHSSNSSQGVTDEDRALCDEYWGGSNTTTDPAAS